MNSRLILVAAASLFLVGALGCSNKHEATQAATSNAGTISVDMATAGSISGTVHLVGNPPRMKIINMAAEPNCAKEHTTPQKTQEVETGEGGTLQNVVVYLEGDFSHYKFDIPQASVTIDQKGCMYDPHVLALQTGQTLQVVNSDPVTHNIHPLPKDNREWNQSQPPGSAPIMQSFAREEVAIPVKCNIHPWMKGYIAVFSDPYFAVTGKDGAFSFKNVPPGTYSLMAWQELYGTQKQSVTLGPKESKVVDVQFNAEAAGS